MSCAASTKRRWPVWAISTCVAIAIHVLGGGVARVPSRDENRKNERGETGEIRTMR